jgi:hypothetical protein
MKRLASVMFFLVVCAPSAFAASWQGDLFVKTATASCETNGILVDTFYRGIFRPLNYGESPSTRFSLLSPKNGQYYDLGANFDFYSTTGTYKGMAISSTAQLNEWSGTFSGAKKTPHPHSSATPALVIRIAIANFAGIANCEATLMGTLGLRPET